MQTGWLGRWLDTYGSKDNPLQAISLDSSLSKQIRSNKAPVCAIQNLNGSSFQIPSVSTNNPNAEVGKLAGGPGRRRATTRSPARARSTA